MPPLPSSLADCATMRPCTTVAVFLAESSPEGMTLQTKANALALRRKYRTAHIGNVGHDCSRVKLVIR